MLLTYTTTSIFIIFIFAPVETINNNRIYTMTKDIKPFNVSHTHSNIEDYTMLQRLFRNYLKMDKDVFIIKFNTLKYRIIMDKLTEQDIADLKHMYDRYIYGGRDKTTYRDFYLNYGRIGAGVNELPSGYDENGIIKKYNTYSVTESNTSNTSDEKPLKHDSRNDYNAIRMIKLMHTDAILKKLYNGKIDGGYRFRLLLQGAKAGTLSDDISFVLKHIFESVVEVEPQSMNKYINLKEVIRKTPTRYGKVQLNNDIAEQGGEATATQQTLLDVAALETLRQKILYRGISDHYKGTDNISDDNHQKIQELVRSFNTCLLYTSDAADE